MTFGASDMPLKGEELEKDGLVQFPTVMGGVVPVVNLDGIKPGELVLDGPTLANIYPRRDQEVGRRRRSRSSIPASSCRRQAIAVVHRSDGSGTTFIFTDYLSKVSADWKAKVGADTAVEWPVGIGAKGNEGVANNVAQTKGSIGYVEYAYAKQNKLTLHQHDQQGRQDRRADHAKPSRPPPPTPTGAARPAIGVDPDRPAGRRRPGRSPAPTFILIHKQPQDPAAAAEALKFFDWAYAKGDKMAEELDYIPMPEQRRQADREPRGLQRSRTRRQAHLRRPRIEALQANRARWRIAPRCRRNGVASTAPVAARAT